VLAIQGGFAAHVSALGSLGAHAHPVRTAQDMAGLDGLIIPGGESTAITMGIQSAGLEPAIHDHHAEGRPLLGTCAGMIICDDTHLGLIDATARRNAFGSQLQSFETDLHVDGIGPEPLRAIFIRAPWIERWGDGVDVLASHDGHPVVIRDGSVLACSFHPELTDDQRIHSLFMAMISGAQDRYSEEARS